MNLSHLHRPALVLWMASAVFVYVLFASTGAPAVFALANQASDKPSATPPYSEEQSARGGALYEKSCSFCHNDKSMAPPLLGDEFLTRWSNKTAGALFDKIQLTMPANEPGSITDQGSADLVAYVLKLNHLPAGPNELPKDPAKLGGIDLLWK